MVAVPSENLIPTMDLLGKRKRSDDSPGCNFQGSGVSDWSGLKFVRFEKLWFDDGNIVCRARTNPSEPGVTPVVQGIKCHKSILAEQSQVFKAMLELPQAAQATYEGLPCLDFPDDFEDVKNCLLKTYGTLYKSYGPDKWTPSYDPMPSFFGPLKLAVKYKMPAHKKTFSRASGTLFPSEYKAWCGLEECYRFTIVEYHRRVKDPREQETWFDPIQMLLAVEELGLTDLLRAVWYEISRSHASGATPFGQEDAAVGLTRRTIDLRLLDDSHIYRLLVGRERLRDVVIPKLAHLTDAIKATMVSESLAVESDCACKSFVETIWRNAVRGDKLLDVIRDPLGVFARLHSDMKGEELMRSSRSGDTCDCTHEWFDEKLEVVGKEIWDILPQIFDFRLD